MLDTFLPCSVTQFPIFMTMVKLFFASFETLEALKMAEGFLTLLLMCYVPLGSSLPAWACFPSCTMVARQPLSAASSSCG